MTQARPFVSRTHLLGQAGQVWWHLGDGDWLEAFTHHPPIGGDVETLRARFGNTADWSEGEQAGVEGAQESTIQRLADSNQTYLSRYGFLFIVCASGKSADEMLGILQGRLHNELAYELRVAAGEQLKITILRLNKLEATP
jgi:2-oxo-4-hydroxy-4-carboxy-5-ureidoimidazoline decarboxylase